MKRILFIVTAIILASCGQKSDTKSKITQKENHSTRTEIALIDFEGDKFAVGYPETWTLNTEEMNNESSVALITANYKISDSRAITFQVINLVDTASLETGVKNIIAKYSTNAKYSEFKKVEINNDTFINTRIKFAINVSSESYFIKDGDNLFWLTFMGHIIDLDKHMHEIIVIAESFKLKRESNN